jgi:nucleoside 2-deoxyribosyltransferase
MNVYLAGPIELVHRDIAMNWREDAVLMGNNPRLNLHCVNPFREGGETPHRGKKNGRLIHRRDRFLSKNCDILLCNLTDWDACKGVLIEIGWFDAWQKPIFAFCPENSPARQHPMIEDAVCYWTTTLEEALEKIAEFHP